LVWTIVVPLIGIPGIFAVIGGLILSIILIIITFSINKVVAIGFLVGVLWDIAALLLVRLL
jgi:hypothetical protein